MSEELVEAMRPVLFGEKLAATQNFSQLFRDGMKLVEETAAYLDGPGRQDSNGLGRSAALGYANTVRSERGCRFVAPIHAAR